MKFTEEDYKYFSGEKFSNGYQFKLQNNPVYSRQELLLQLVRGKNILHIGCCDHIPLIKNKIANGTWLHGLLEEACTQVIGIDINSNAVEYVNDNNFSRNPVFCADVTSDSSFSAVPKVHLDYVLLGEIVEHVDNPVAFLSAMKGSIRNYSDGGGYCIITVPNGFSFLKKKKYSVGIEGINSDHRYWFTPYTIAKVLAKAGIKPVELFFCNMGAYENGKTKFSRYMFFLYKKLFKKPSSYKAFRSDQIVIIGEL